MAGSCARGLPVGALLIVILLAQASLAVPLTRGDGLIGAIGLEEDCQPRQVHLALGDDPSRMHVSWSTAGSNCPSEVSWWRATWGGALQAPARAVGYSFLLSERDMCAEPAASAPFTAHLHRAVMAGLTPGATHRYRIAGGREAFAFRAQPAPSARERVEFVVFGDMGHASADSPGAPATAETLRRLEVGRTGLIAHVGDISYADGSPEIWDKFMDSIQPVAARVPWMVAVGNHDYSEGGTLADPSRAHARFDPEWGNYGSDSGGECGVHLARRFHMPAAPDAAPADAAAAADGGDGPDAPLLPPSAPPADNAPFWYAFTHGPVRFVTVSTEHDLSPGSPQHGWLARELASADRCATPWLVLLAHRPLYVSAEKRSNGRVAEHIRSHTEDLLLRHRVDAVVSGHVHSYFRSCPLADGECVDAAGDNGPQHGIVHVVVGSAGRKLSGLADRETDPWVAATVGEYGYTRFTVDGADRMGVEFVASEGGRVLDAFTVTPSRARRALACPRGGARGGRGGDAPETA